MNEVTSHLKKKIRPRPSLDYYAGKRVLTIGARRRVLKKVTAVLKNEGFAANYSSDYKNPGQVFRDFISSRFDVVVMGRGLKITNKQFFKSFFKEQNRDTIFVDGLASIPGLVVHQVKRACMPEYVFPCDVRQLSDRIKITVPSAGNLKVICYRLNWLYKSKMTVIMNKPVTEGIVEIPLKISSGKNFIAISLDGIATNVIALKSMGFR